MLPIGGLRQKSTAAHRAGITHIIAPFLNKKDLEELPERVSNDLNFSFVKEMDEVLKLAF